MTSTKYDSVSLKRDNEEDYGNRGGNSHSWDDEVYESSLTLSNLRVRTFQRRSTIACCLNVWLLVALIVALLGLAYFIASPFIKSWRKQVVTSVATHCGVIEGVSWNGIAAFLGIPYALPPTETRRFRPPVELISKSLCSEVWPQTDSHEGKEELYLNAKSYRPPCLQLKPTTNEVIGSEDCLYLNIFVPPDTSVNSLKPVVVVINGLLFLYGGGFGPAGQPNQKTVQTVDAIHVTFNYRVGALGFLVHPSTRKANLGLYDQLALLRWVRSNIAAFGGDPSNVILFGYGAGATSALALSYSSHAQHLFDGMWISAPAVGKPSVSMEQALQTSRQLLQCDRQGVLCGNESSINASNIVKLWNWEYVEPWLRKDLFSLPNIAETDSENVRDSSTHRLRHVLVDDGELVNAQRWYRPGYPLSLVLGQTSHEASIYLQPVLSAFWGQEEYLTHWKDYIANNYSGVSISSLIDGSYFGARWLDSSALTCGTRNNSRGEEILGFDVEAHLAGAITDARFTCPIAHLLLNNFLGSVNSLPIYQYYLTGRHIRFDPYGMTSFVSLAHHGWDGEVYLRSYHSHSDYQEGLRLLNSGKPGEDDAVHLEKASNHLNEAMHEFARKRTPPGWQALSRNEFPVNFLHQSDHCEVTLKKVMEDRCHIWSQLANGDHVLLQRFAWKM